jgi:hypothetical protein
MHDPLRPRPRPRLRIRARASTALLTLALGALACGGDDAPKGPVAFVGLGAALVTVEAPSYTVAATQPLMRPADAVATDGKSVWAVATNPPSDLVMRVDLKTKTEAMIPLPDRTQPRDVAVGEGAVWIAGGNDTLVRLNKDTGAIVTTIKLGTEPASANDTKQVAAGMGGVWVTSATAPRKLLVRVDPKTNAVVQAIDLADEASALGVAVGEGGVFVVTRGPNTLWKVDPANNKVAKKLMLGFDPAISAGPIAVGDGSVYVLDKGGKGLLEVDARTVGNAEPWMLGESPDAVAVGKGGVWVTLPQKVLRMESGAAVSTLNFESRPVGLAVLP